ncbi:MAG: hypothetical protein JW840_04180 [Candidatus Thermoplasmatota archaeon]|nr:hypothetical protein [Candidatus Thermoplasmatota archaeon]
MKKQLLLIGLASILVSVVLSGCNQVQRTLTPEESKFVGIWVTDEETAQQDLGEQVTFFSNGTVTFHSHFSGTYQVDEGNYLIVQITADGIQTQHLFDYEFSENNTTLRLLYQNTGGLYLYTKE